MPSEPTLYVPARFNGPRESGQGGYTAGLIAMRMGELAEVSLRAPIPLDRELKLTEHDHGGIDVHDGETLVAEAKPRELELEVPEPVGIEEARAASARYRACPTASSATASSAGSAAMTRSASRRAPSRAAKS